MPKQHVLFGRPIPRFGTRRLSFLLACISIFAVFSLLFTLPSAIPAGPSLSTSGRKFSIPRLKNSIFSGKGLLNPFKPPPHPPPRQRNDTYEESSWWSDWKWLSVPFSSSLTLDEDRALLPPLRERPPIYCYYDATVDKTDAARAADSALLLTWRRAWWAQGFKPVILSEAEATNNPMYNEVQQLEIDDDIKLNIKRWLAWENMGGGILAQHFLFPMGAYDDPLLTYLRRGEYPRLTRWRELDNGIYVGPKPDITKTIKTVIEGSKLKTAKDFVAAAPEEAFNIDKAATALAYYDPAAIKEKYVKLTDDIAKDDPEAKAKFLDRLNQLVNAHLHSTWQNIFTSGIAVLKPLPHHTTHMIEPAKQLATDLGHCSTSPIPSSCPPNLPLCRPCVATSPVRVSTPARYLNDSALYTIGTVPHPYTLASLHSQRDDIDVAWIRRHSDRDPWLLALTQQLLGTGVTGGLRIRSFKEAVAGPFALGRALWLTAEKPVPDDVAWHFGFAIPRNVSDGKSETPVPGPERRPKQIHDPGDGPIASDDELDREVGLLGKARDLVLKGKKKGRGPVAVVRRAVEAWNLADTEAWKFARAYLARETVERMEWDKEEARYTRGAGSEKDATRSGWSRWVDGDDKVG